MTAMDVRIYQPAKSATQSGRANTKRWVLEFETTTRRKVDTLMGWTGAGDTRAQLSMRFDAKADAIAFARRNDLSYQVEEPRPRHFRPKAYSDNFIRRT